MSYPSCPSRRLPLSWRSRRRGSARWIHAGQIRARKVGGRWLVDAGSLARPRPVSGRPMSTRMAWAVMAKADGRHVPGLAATERRRLSEKLSILAERVGTEDASVILTAWVRNRGRRVVLHSSDVRSLEVDPRVWASGVSDARAKIAAIGVFEGYSRRTTSSRCAVTTFCAPRATRPTSTSMSWAACRPDGPATCRGCGPRGTCRATRSESGCAHLRGSLRVIVLPPLAGAHEQPRVIASGPGGWLVDES